MIVRAINDDSPKTYKITFGVYLDGILEEKNGYDLVSFKTPKNDGIYDCLVIINGQLFPSKLFFWRTDCDRGLIVSNDDADAIKHAEQKYNERAIVI